MRCDPKMRAEPRLRFANRYVFCAKNPGLTSRILELPEVNPP